MEVKKEQLQRALKVLKEVVSKQKKGSDEIFETTDKLNLLFSLIKVFPGKGKILKIQLPHKPHSSGVCMFVADVDRTSRDYQTTIATYEKFLSDHHVSQQIDIMPLKRVKLEHSEFEKKRSLSNFYDVFLCDARIIHLMPEILGKHFIGRKKFLIQVRLDSKDLKDEVDKALKTTTCAIKNRGASSMVTFGDMTLSEDQLLDNLQQVLDILMKEVKGGWSNIRSMVLKGSQSIAVPLYQSHAPKDSVKVEKKMREASSNVVKQKIPGLKGKYDVTKAEEVSTVRNAKVLVTEAGDIILLANKKEKKGKDMVEEEKELDEIDDDDDDDDEEEEEEDDDDEIDYELVRNKKKRVLKEKKKKTNKKVKLDLNPEDDNKKTKDNKNAKDTKNKSKNPKKTNESSPRGPKVLVRRTRYNMVYSSGRIGHTGVKKRPVMRKKVKLVKKGGGGVKRRSGKITSKYGGTNSGESKKENGTEVIKSKSESSGGVEKLGDKKKNNNKNKPNKSVKNTENIKKMGEKSNNKNNSSKKKIDKKNMKNNNDNKKNNKDNNDNKKIKNKNNKDNNMHNKKNTTKVSKKKAKKEDGLQNESTPAKKKIKINQ